MSELAKPCSKCKEVKSFAEFSPSSKTKTGRASACKVCSANAVREYYAKSPEIRRQKYLESREYLARNPHKQSEYNRRRYEKIKADPVKLEAWARSREAKARKALNNAVRWGHLTKLPCMVCGEVKSEAHHWSYEPEHWLNVQWYCKKHHMEIHKKHQEREKTDNSKDLN